VCGQAGEVALEGAHGGAGGTDDDNRIGLGHGKTPVKK
jgi:hypothetical protein